MIIPGKSVIGRENGLWAIVPHGRILDRPPNGENSPEEIHIIKMKGTVEGVGIK
jgi:hypothetical protein